MNNNHAMQKLRSIHLYLGCLFAPMMLFFTVSGVWQTLRIYSPFLWWLTAIHTGFAFKNGHAPSGPTLRIFIVIMALSFVVSIVLGVIMAFKFGRNRKAAFYCLAAGVIIPLALVLARVSRW